MIIVTLTKLFVIRIVASVRSLSSRNFRILLSLDVFCAFSSAMSDGDRLKKAISEPLANADIAISIRVSAIHINTPVVGAMR